MGKIRWKRESVKMSQSELSKRIGISQPYLCDIENGNRRGSTKVLQKIAAALGCSVDELATKDNSAPEDEKGATP